MEMREKERLFHKHKNDMRKLSYYIAHKYGLDFEDVLGEAHYIFCVCCEKFNEKKGNFENYLKSCLRGVFLNLIQEKRELDHLINPDIEIEKVSFSTIDTYSRETIKSLSPDSQAVFETILDIREKTEKPWMVSAISQKAVKKSLREEKNWTHKRIHKSFSELKQALNFI